MLGQQEFRTALECLLAAYESGTYEEWREAMRLLAAGTSPEQWEEVVGHLGGASTRPSPPGPVVRERILAADRRAS